MTKHKKGQKLFKFTVKTSDIEYIGLHEVTKQLSVKLWVGKLFITVDRVEFVINSKAIIYHWLGGDVVLDSKVKIKQHPVKSCKHSKQTEAHMCPYRSDINGDDTLCTCCSRCKTNCAEDR